MNLRQLNLLHDDDPAAIRALAGACGLDPVLALGVAKLLLAHLMNLVLKLVRPPTVGNPCPCW